MFFKIDSRKVNHVGIYIGKHRFVHAPGAGKPVTINSLDDEFYADAIFLGRTLLEPAAELASRHNASQHELPHRYVVFLVRE